MSDNNDWDDFEDPAAPPRPGRPRESAPPSGSDPAPTLLELLEMYQALLGWSQTDLSRATGIDQADLSRIFSGKVRRPHPDTLRRIYNAYQAAGLQGISFDDLLAARSRRELPSGQQHPFEIEPQWRRLFRRVQALAPEDQEALYRIYAIILNEWALGIGRNLRD